MKVKIFNSYIESILESDINEWAEQTKVSIIDMKYSAFVDNHNRCLHTVLVIYNEKDV